MIQSRRSILMAGAAMGLLAPVLAGCGPDGPVVDNGTGNNTGAPNTTGGGDNTTGSTTGGGDNTTGGNTTGGNTTGGNTTGGNTTGGGGSSTGTGGGTLPPGPRIRYDVASPQGQQMLAVYARAVAAMMALPDGDPRSWTFQWYSHWVKGALDQSGKTAELARVYGGVASPQHSLAQQMWSGCQAHGDSADEVFFLPWHRMFVLAFENIIRGVAGEPNFTLPYWNYLDPSQRAIPSAFRRPGDPTYGALYRSTRNGTVNAGAAIGSASDLNASILSESTYSPLGADQGFCANLDFGLHGAVHVGVGNSVTGMGVVPWAAGDPVFWLHHCNIDRLWASWNAEGNANPSDSAFLSKPFPFADQNGARITYTVANVLSIAQAGYSYDALVSESGAALPQAASLDLRRPAPARVRAPGFSLFDKAVAATTQPPGPVLEAAKRPIPILRVQPSITHVAEGVQLGAGTLRVRLTSTQAAPEVATRTLAPLIAAAPRMQRRGMTAPASPSGNFFAFLGSKAPMKSAGVPPAPAPAPPPPSIPAPKPGQKVFLVINNMSTDVQPGVLYQIYMEAPRSGGAPQQFAIGTLNFFSAMGSMGGMKMASRARSYDITDLAAQLAAQGRLEASPAISFVPIGKPANQAQPLIGSMSLAIQ